MIFSQLDFNNIEISNLRPTKKLTVFDISYLLGKDSVCT